MVDVKPLRADPPGSGPGGHLGQGLAAQDAVDAAQLALHGGGVGALQAGDHGEQFLEVFEAFLFGGR